MTRFHIVNRHGAYFKAPFHGSTADLHEAHAYTEALVYKYPHLVRGLARGTLQRVPVTEPALAGEQGGNHA